MTLEISISWRAPQLEKIIVSHPGKLPRLAKESGPSSPKVKKSAGKSVFLYLLGSLFIAVH